MGVPFAKGTEIVERLVYPGYRDVQWVSPSRRGLKSMDSVKALRVTAVQWVSPSRRGLKSAWAFCFHWALRRPMGVPFAKGTEMGALLAFNERKSQSNGCP